MYGLLVDLPRTSPRFSGFWAASLKRPINWWTAVWRKSRLKLIENKKTYLLWLIIHRAIKVRYALKTWGYKVKSDKCALCSQVERALFSFLPWRARCVEVFYALSVSPLLFPFFC